MLASLLALLAGLFQIDVTEIPTETPIESMPPDPFGPGDGLPPPDTPFVYTGAGMSPAWSDVYDSAQKDYRSDPLLGGNTQFDQGLSTTVHLDQVAIRSVLRAVSGFINRAYDDATQNINLLSSITDAEIGDIVGRINRIVRVLRQMADEVNGLSLLIVPNLQNQINAWAAELHNEIIFRVALQQQWTIDHVLKPLFAEALTVQPRIDTAVAHEHASSQAYTDTAVAALGVSVLRAFAPVQTALKTLVAESENCTKPMCETMGPNTNLGKFLKGLNIAADAALIAALLNMTESDLAGFINTLTSHLAGVVGDVEQFLQPGGETVAGLIKSATGDLI